MREDILGGLQREKDAESGQAAITPPAPPEAAAPVAAAVAAGADILGALQKQKDGETAQYLAETGAARAGRDPQIAPQEAASSAPRWGDMAASRLARQAGRVEDVLADIDQARRDADEAEQAAVRRYTAARDAFDAIRYHPTRVSAGTQTEGQKQLAGLRSEYDAARVALAQHGVDPDEHVAVDVGKDALDAVRAVLSGGDRTWQGLFGALSAADEVTGDLGRKGMKRITGDEKYDEPYISPFREYSAFHGAQASRALQETTEERGKLGAGIMKALQAGGNLAFSASLSALAGPYTGLGVSTAETEIGATGMQKVASAITNLGARFGNKLLKSPTNAIISAESAGNTYVRAAENDADRQGALADAIGVGLLEYVSNQLFSGTPLEDTAEKGYVTMLIERLVERLGKSDALKRFLGSGAGKAANWTFDKLGEGLEEVITGLGDPILERITWNPEADLATADELADEFTGGVLLALIMSGGEIVADNTTGRLAHEGQRQSIALPTWEEVEAIRRGSETKTAAPVTETAENEPTVRMEDLMQETDAEKAARLRKAEITVTEAKERTESEKRFDFGFLKRLGATEAAKYLVPILERLGITGRNYRNVPLDISFEYTKRGAKRSISHQNKDVGAHYDAFALVQDNLENLCKNAYPLEAHADEKPKTADSHVTQVATLGSVLRTGGGLIPVRMTIKFYDNEGAKLHVIINGPDPLMDTWTSQTHSVSGTEPAITITEFLHLVNGNKAFGKRIPESIRNAAAVNFAEALELQGFDADLIERETGLRRDADGNWIEIPTDVRDLEYIPLSEEGQEKNLKGIDKSNENGIIEPPNAEKPSVLSLPDVSIGQSLGAKAKNYDIMDLKTREVFHLVEGSHLQDVEIFAGSGVKTQYDRAYVYAERYGGENTEWQHVKAVGVVDYYGEPRKAEVHWSQCEGFGKHDFFIKEWLE